MSSQPGRQKTTTVIHFMPWSGIGGVEIATLRMAQATQGLVRNVAFCLPDAHALRVAFNDIGVETETYAPPEPSIRRGFSYFHASRRLAHQMAKYHADIAHFSDEKAAYHNSLAALLAGMKRICHLRVSYAHLAFRNRLCLLPVQSFIFVSKEAMDSFAISLPDSKRRVVYDAVDMPEINVAAATSSVREELRISSESVVIGMLARVSAQKDYFTLAAAAVKVLQEFPAARFLVVGDNSLVELNRKHYAEVLARLNELGIADNFIFTGHRDDTQRLVAAMDFCVLSTHREGFPLSILESMALGKPVIATAVGGIPEIVSPGVTGYLHKHEDSDELAHWILQLIRSPDIVHRMGLAAKEHVRSQHSRQKYITEIQQAYADAMQI